MRQKTIERFEQIKAILKASMPKLSKYMKYLAFTIMLITIGELCALIGLASFIIVIFFSPFIYIFTINLLGYAIEDFWSPANKLMNPKSDGIIRIPVKIHRVARRHNNDT